MPDHRRRVPASRHDPAREPGEHRPGWRVPGCAVGRRPRIGRNPVLDEPAQAGQAELLRRPFVEPPDPWPDHAVVEDVPEPVLAGDIALGVVAERIAVRQDPRQRQKDPGHSDPRVAEQRSGRAQPAQREPRCGDHGMRIQHANQDHVEEEALDPAFGARQLLVLEVRGDDADVVGAVPAPGRWTSDELDRGLHARRRAGVVVPGDERAGLVAVADQSLVDGTPPGAAGGCGVRWVEQSTSQTAMT